MKQRSPDLTGDEELWGLDPGRRDLFVMVNEEGEKLKCSTREFYHDAKYKLSNAKDQALVRAEPGGARGDPQHAHQEDV